MIQEHVDKTPHKKAECGNYSSQLIGKKKIKCFNYLFKFSLLYQPLYTLNQKTVGRMHNVLCLPFHGSQACHDSKVTMLIFY